MELTRAVRNTICKTVRSAVLDTHSSDSCVASVRVLQEVLKIGYGIDVYPKVVTVIIFNPFVTKKLDAGKLRSNDDLIAAVRSPAGHSVGIGMGAQAAVDPNKWAGHLVALEEPESGFELWDPSLDQANRPTKSIFLEPHCTHLPDHDLPPGEMFTMLMRDSRVTYERKELPDYDFRTSPDWDLNRFTGHVQRSLELLAQRGGAYAPRARSIH